MSFTQPRSSIANTLSFLGDLFCLWFPPPSILSPKQFPTYFSHLKLPWISGDRNSRGSMRHGRYSDDESIREHRHRDHDRRHHRGYDERRCSNRINIMDFMKIRPPLLTGDDNDDFVEAWVNITEQGFRVLHYDENEKMELADFMIQGKDRKLWIYVIGVDVVWEVVMEMCMTLDVWKRVVLLVFVS
ncbi:uncharacterized protein LOC142519617 [Primulina tabacum]|uniref:uncharacterized protein LOC142519617 n=1 Tax=Primulina tabacum TaxID=48773 RepID=UPI003F5A30AD